MLTPIDLKTLSIKHPDALVFFEMVVGSMEKFKRKTIADFDFFYSFPDPPPKKSGLKKVIPIPTSLMPDRKFGDFLSLIEKERNSHEPGATEVKEEVHPENDQNVFKGTSGVAIHMTQRGFPGQFVLIEQYPLMTDPRVTQKTK